MAALFAALKNFAARYSEAQRRVIKETSNGPWGPTAAGMVHLADLTFLETPRHEIMTIIWKRLTHKGRNWRHVHKSLILIEFLIKNGSEKVEEECNAEIATLRNLKYFIYKRNGKDYGKNVRDRASEILKLIVMRIKLRVIIEANIDSPEKAQIEGFTYDLDLLSDILAVIWYYLKQENKIYIYNALVLLKYLLINGSNLVSNIPTEKLALLLGLTDYQYVGSGKIEGEGIRNISREVFDLIRNRDLLEAERSKVFCIREEDIYETVDKELETDEFSDFLTRLVHVSHDKEACRNILAVIWENFSNPVNNCNRVYGFLRVLEHLVMTLESETVLEECAANIYIIENLTQRQFIINGEDKFERIREKSELLYDVVKNFEMKQEHLKTSLENENAEDDSVEYSGVQKVVMDLILNEDIENCDETLSGIADVLSDEDVFADVMDVFWDQIYGAKNTAKQVCNALGLLEYLIRNDNQQLTDYIEEIARSIDGLKTYTSYEKGIDTGKSVRNKAKETIKFLNKIKIQRSSKDHEEACGRGKFHGKDLKSPTKFSKKQKNYEEDESSKAVADDKLIKTKFEETADNLVAIKNLPSDNIAFTSQKTGCSEGKVLQNSGIDSKDKMQLRFPGKLQDLKCSGSEGVDTEKSVHNKVKEAIALFNTITSQQPENKGNIDEKISYCKQNEACQNSDEEEDFKLALKLSAMSHNSTSGRRGSTGTISYMDEIPKNEDDEQRQIEQAIAKSQEELKSRKISRSFTQFVREESTARAVRTKYNVTILEPVNGRRSFDKTPADLSNAPSGSSKVESKQIPGKLNQLSIQILEAHLQFSKPTPSGTLNKKSVLRNTPTRNVRTQPPQIPDILKQNAGRIVLPERNATCNSRTNAPVVPPPIPEKHTASYSGIDLRAVPPTIPERKPSSSSDFRGVPEDDSLLCVVCMSSPKEMLLVDCKHVCLCEFCAQKYKPVMKNYRWKDDEEGILSQCPLCRQLVTEKPVKIHL